MCSEPYVTSVCKTDFLPYSNFETVSESLGAQSAADTKMEGRSVWRSAKMVVAAGEATTKPDVINTLLASLCSEALQSGHCARSSSPRNSHWMRERMGSWTNRPTARLGKHRKGLLFWRNLEMKSQWHVSLPRVPWSLFTVMVLGLWQMTCLQMENAMSIPKSKRKYSYLCYLVSFHCLCF